MRVMFRAGAALFGLALGGVAAHGAQAGTNLVQNGGFETLGPGITTPQQITGGSIVADWSVPTPPASYAFLFFTASGQGPATLGSANTEYGGTVNLYGPDSQYVSPNGGNIVGMDSSFQTGAISQTINGLTVGTQYAVSFDWAGAQQVGFSGDVSCGTNPDPGNCTTDQWQVSLGGQTLDTPVTTVANHGFSGWMEQTLVFTATTTSEALAFIAVGTPGGAPPFALLDGVSLIQVPEPTTGAIMLAGFAALGALGLRCRKRHSDDG